MLTGRQVREARKLLGWRRLDLGRHALLTVPLIDAVESSDGTAWLSSNQEDAIRRALEAAGVEFIPENGGGAGVRLRQSPAAPPSPEPHE